MNIGYYEHILSIALQHRNKACHKGREAVYIPPVPRQLHHTVPESSLIYTLELPEADKQIGHQFCPQAWESIVKHSSKVVEVTGIEVRDRRQRLTSMQANPPWRSLASRVECATSCWHGGYAY